jgi:TPP-dependent 2-oxoacid decarboxylase
MEHLDGVTIVKHLGNRLRELGVTDLFGVPGDFNLSLLDALVSTGHFRWHGSPNELNAGYAADGYARIRGLAAVITTYRVGELSCIDAIGGSYAENLPVIHIAGMPGRQEITSGALLHHTFCDGDLLHFSRAYREFTCATIVLSLASNDSPWMEAKSMTRGDHMLSG